MRRHLPFLNWFTVESPKGKNQNKPKQRPAAGTEKQADPLAAV